jgi:ceramide glucosyltransferase
MVLAWALVAFCLAATLLHVGTTLLFLCRCRRSFEPKGRVDFPSRVTVIRPVCGLDPMEQITLGSTFNLEATDLQLFFCCATARDTSVPFLRRLIASQPGRNACLLIGNSLGTANPKLNNVAKGWEAASSEWIVLSDSNLLLPPDYVERLLATWSSDTGLVCAPPIGSAPANFWAEVECGFLNTYQARWQYAADSIGFGFAQGKTMLWRRSDLDRQGGIAALAAELAEDAAATKLVRSAGLRVRLADPSFYQPLGVRSAFQVLSRQVRWAQLRRSTFPAFFAPEILTGSLFPIIAGAFAASLLDTPPAAVLPALVTLWFGSEAVLCRAAGWHLGWRSPLAWALRDILIPVIWLRALVTDGFEWRGHTIVGHRLMRQPA